MDRITVFTATYNRENLLPRLYASLLEQTDKDFEWLIIDDASSDNTVQLIKEWIQENKIKIKIVIEEVNGGLQRAINHAYSIVDDGYMLKIDSDDYLLPNAIAFFRNKIRAINDEKCVGIGALYKKNDMSLMHNLSKDNMPQNNVSLRFHQRSDYGYGCDCIEIYKVDIRKKYPIPIWPTEKIGPERVAFSNMDEDGYFIQWFSEPVAVVNYQESGLTNYEKIHWDKDPMSKAITYNYYQSYHFYDIKTRLYYSTEFVFWSLKGHKVSFLRKTRKPHYLIYGLPIGICKYIVRCLRY